MTATAEYRTAPHASFARLNLPDGLSLPAEHLITNAPVLNDSGHYLPYYQLLTFAPDFQLALTEMSRKTPHYGALETLIAWSIAEALDAIPILSVPFWRTMSLHPAVCEAASLLLDDAYATLHHRLAEELTLFGLAQDPETRFENIFPALWTGPKLTLSGQVHDQIDPLVKTSLLAKIANGDISAETATLRPAQLSRIVDALTHRPGASPKRPRE